MATVNLPTPIGLSQEKGVIGHMLSQLPNTVLVEAETQNNPWSWLANWVKKNPIEHLYVGTIKQREADCAGLEREGFKRTDTDVYPAPLAPRRAAKIYQGVREVRFHSHTYDSAKIITRVVMDKCWPDSFHKTFLAAASQRTALLALSKIGRSGGSLSRNNLVEEMLAADKRGDTKTAEHLSDRYLRSVFQTARGRRWLLDDLEKSLSLPPKMHEYARQKYDAFYAADLVRLGRKKADEKWKSEKPLRPKLTNPQGYLIAEKMTLNWLSVGDTGVPGYCFISDKILATILGLTLPLRGLLPSRDDADNQRGRKIIEDRRREIGLQKAVTLVTGIKQIGNEEWAVLDEAGNEMWSLTAAKTVPPNLAG